MHAHTGSALSRRRCDGHTGRRAGPPTRLDLAGNPSDADRTSSAPCPPPAAAWAAPCPAAGRSRSPLSGSSRPVRTCHWQGAAGGRGKGKERCHGVEWGWPVLQSAACCACLVADVDGQLVIPPQHGAHGRDVLDDACLAWRGTQPRRSEWPAGSVLQKKPEHYMFRFLSMSRALLAYSSMQATTHG